MRKTYFIMMALIEITACAFAQNKPVTLPEKPNRDKYIDYSTKESGWWCAVQLGTSFGDTAVLFQTDFVTGYRFSEMLKIGVGVSPRIGLKSVPLYFDARGNFVPKVDRMYAFYWNADLGYAINDGMFFSPGIGMAFGGVRHNFLVGVNYTLQDFKDAEVKHFGGIRIGYEF